MIPGRFPFTYVSRGAKPAPAAERPVSLNPSPHGYPATGMCLWSPVKESEMLASSSEWTRP